MSPEKLKKLMEIPDFSEFVDFLVSCAAPLKQLPATEGKDAEQIALDVKAQEKAFDVLAKILDPLLNPPQAPTSPRKNEFNM